MAINGGLAPVNATFTMTPDNVPTTITKNKTYTSAVLPTYGIPHIGVAGNTDQDSTLSLQLYLDTAGTIVQGAAVTKGISKGTMAYIDNVATTVTSSFTISIINGNVADTTVTALTVVLQK